VTGRLARAAACAVLALAALPATAAADHHDENLPWPQLLPALPVTTAVQPHPVRHCPRATVRCMDDLLRRLRTQWRGLDARCDHRALFSLAYIRITRGLRDDLARRHPLYFRYRSWFIDVIADFSNRYFAIFQAYARGRPVPGSWKVAYDEATRGDASGGQDVLLASNAHTQHDLPYVYAGMGMRTRAGASRKHDHDGVNAVNTRVFDGLEDYYAEHYDQQFTWIDLKPSPLDEIGTMEMVKGWREGAWRNAERLLNARTAEERRRVDQSIETTANLWADFIRSGDQPGYRAQRDAYCRAQKRGAAGA
jgi:Family of unknown function (DUF5995)